MPKPGRLNSAASSSAGAGRLRATRPDDSEGAGRRGGWQSVAARPRVGVDLFVAGGLDADCVGEAIERLRPDGVDVATGRRVVAANSAPEIDSTGRPTIADVADHVEHVRDVAGVDHVGIGADFFGEPTWMAAGLEDVASYPALFAELLRRGWTEEDLAKLSRGNVLRVLRGAEEAAATQAALFQRSGVLGFFVAHVIAP